MRRLIYAATLSIFFSVTVFGRWALIPLDELVRDSDLIVIGTLHSAVEDSFGIGKGYILVERIVTHGTKTLDGAPLAAGDNLKINWADGWACAAGMHRGREGKPGVWLLNVKDDGTVAAAYPGRFVEIRELSEIQRLLRKRSRTNSARVDLLNEEKSLVSDSEIVAKRLAMESTPRPVDVAPYHDYFPFRGLVALLFSTGLYVILYRSRFRIR